MARTSLVFQNVSFGYDTSVTPLLREVSFGLPAGWTGVIGANGIGKSTLLRLAAGELVPWSGSIRSPGPAVYCAQRTDDPPGELPELLEATDADACRIRGILAVEESWPERWNTLSHGKRKRAQIAVVLWRPPSLLVIDEPTNHLDTEARRQILEGLRLYRGVGLVVSHDRELLDALCARCLFVRPSAVTLRPGGFDQGLAEERREAESRQKQHEVADAEHRRLRREASRRRDRAAREASKRPKRHLSRKDHDAREKIDRARVSGKDAVGGRQLRQIQGRLRRSEEKRAAARVEKAYDAGIWVAGSVSRRDVLFRLPAATLPLGDGRDLRIPDLSMRPDDRVALTGPNGAGKSTLVRHVLRHLAIPEENLAYIPQEIDRDAGRGIMEAARALPGERLGRMMNIVSRLGSRPAPLMESADPSPGEIRKVLLATNIARDPQLIILDEPTNHLDLPSIECLEEALADCPCGLLLVSHDRRFLKRLTRRRWHIERLPHGSNGWQLHDHA